MKFRAFTVGLLGFAIAAGSIAYSTHALAAFVGDSRGHHGPSPSPLPPRPDVPTFPTRPGDPTLPPLPTIPPPGKPNPAGEPGVPFPLSITLPFPWGNIEGIWKVVADNVDIQFSFTVQTDTNGHQYLRVLQIDSTGTVIAEGVGIGVEQDKLVRAAMTSKATKKSYMLFIGSYKNTNPYVVGGQSVKSVTVVTVRPFTALMGDHDVQAVVTKMSNDPYSINLRRYLTF